MLLPTKKQEKQFFWGLLVALLMSQFLLGAVVIHLKTLISPGERMETNGGEGTPGEGMPGEGMLSIQESRPI